MAISRERYTASFFGVSLSPPKAAGNASVVVDGHGNDKLDARTIRCYEELRFTRPEDREFYQQNMYGDAGALERKVEGENSGGSDVPHSVHDARERIESGNVIITSAIHNDAVIGSPSAEKIRDMSVPVLLVMTLTSDIISFRVSYMSKKKPTAPAKAFERPLYYHPIRSFSTRLELYSSRHSVPVR
uniref:Uncharacterized protein n=1 Tax=Hyaloperonospora arabidopsidis (strain Emoy2) TaxID=559515 RepID=M4BUK3_HYAAE